MNQMLILWISTGIFFLIIEMFTGTLYGLSLSLAGFILAGYVALNGDTEFTVIQALILAVTSALFSYFFPKWFTSRNKDESNYSNSPIGREVGKTFVLKESKGVFRISIDGVDYLVDENSITKGFASGKKVMLDGDNGSTVKVTLLSM